MENLNETVSKAGELYEGNYHCCEAIVLAVSEHFDCKDDLLLKISTPFGGGMTSNGAVCGSLIAAYLCMGIFKGRASENESRNNACEPANRIFNKFCQKYGSPNCRDITGYDKKDPKAVELYGKKVKCEVCIPLTKEVTRWILEELNQENENL
jgi:C_GCAxxG_C_C family probable redox protein